MGLEWQMGSCVLLQGNLTSVPFSEAAKACVMRILRACNVCKHIDGADFPFPR